jgi:hypothetical protein
MLGYLLHAPRGPFYSPKAGRSRWRSTWKAILAFCRVVHRTATLACPVPISFLFWHRRPLQLWASWRTGHCPVPAADRWSCHASRADCAADRWRRRPLAHRTVRWIVVVRRQTFFESSLFSGNQPGAPDTVRCTTGQSGVPGRAGLRLHLAKSFAILFFFSLFLTLRQIY